MVKMHRLLVYLCILIAMINCKDVVEETLEFVIQGESKMKLSEEPEAIIVIGNTGSGKSTFVHYLQDPSQVESIESERPEAIDYIVVDHMDVAPDSVSTTVSKTIVPELIIDQRNKVWYDCPGFSDTRNSSVEISTTFFLKSVLDNTRFLKIVFVVNFGSVSVGYDRLDFDTLMMHATKLIKNIGRYNSSVALIISKTPSFRIRGRKIFDVEENDTIQSTGDFIADYRTVLSEKPDSEMKLKLVDALLEKSNDGKYSKIGIFFRPNDIGTFDKIPKMMETRTSLLKLINERLNYTEIQHDDVAYTLSARAELDIQAMITLVERNISSTVIKMDEIIANQIHVIGGKKDSLYSRLDFFEAMNEQIDKIGRIPRKLQFKKWMQETHDFLTYFNLSIPRDDFKHLIRQQKAINLISLLSPLTVSNDYALEATQKCVKEEQNWYSFLVYLYEFLSSYDVQKTPESYNVQDINDWGHADRPQGLYLHVNNWKQFLSVQKGFYELIKPIFMTSMKFNEINEIIRSTVQSKMDVQCSGQLAVFKAEFILLSKVDATICYHASNIYIFAQNTIYIDDDLIYKNVQNLVIFAHKWNVMLSVKIDLSAESNVEPPSPNEDATERKPDGIDGKPGKPGRNGGNLFGYANIITNGNLLEIDVSGGRGGRGQDGSRAWPEIPTFDIPSSRKYVNNLEPAFILQTRHPSYKYRYVQGHYTESVYLILRAICGRESYRITCKAYARQCCKKDGVAGVGGVGGLSGSVILVEGNKNKTEHTITKMKKQNGEEGENGKQVSPCKTKMLIVNYDVVCYDPTGIGRMFPPSSAFAARTEARFHFDSIVDDDLCNDSEEYSTYINEGREEAKPNKPLEVTFLINDFKSSLIKEMDKPIRFGEVSKIYNAIDSNSNIFNMYSLIDFVYESNLLEIRYFELNENINFLPFYESLLARLQKFGDKMDCTLGKENRKILATLYTMVLTKANALRIGHHLNLVIDVDKYLEVVISNIRKLDEAGRTKLVNEYSDQYRRELNAKIAEADMLINQEVTPYVKEKFKTIDDQLYDVIDEAIDNQQNARNQIYNQEKALMKIRENAILRGMLSALDMVGKAASNAGPYGQLAGSLISMGTGIGRQFIVDPNDTMNRPVEVPRGVTNTILDLGKVVQKRKGDKIEALNKEIERLEKELKDDDKEDVNEKLQRRQDTSISELKKKLEDAKKTENSSEEMINGISDEIKKFVDDEKKAINSDAEIKLSKKQRLTKFFENCGNAVDVLSAGVDVYNTISKDIDKVNKMKQAIRGSRQRLRELRQFEQVVHDKLIPEMIALHNSLEETRKSLGTQSHVALDVQKWKIQETVKDAKAKLLRSIEGYGSESTLSSCMDKLIEALNMIVDIYNRIKDYEEHTRLVFYLGQLQTANFRNIQISDENFRQIFENLTINIQSNIIIGQYLNAVSAFKQTVFPFAANYLEISRLPKSAMSRKDMQLSELIEILAPKIEVLRNSVIEFNSSVINKDDPFMSNAKFGSKYPGSPQFYLWNNKYFEEEIANLLTGKAVYLFADVTQGIHLNAVKFNTINIDFVSPNASIQAEVNQLLAPANILMTHLGTSYYRCGNQFYVIKSPSQLIKFSYKKEYDEPISRNVVYDKLRSSGNILSPYTLWSIKLEDADFNKLRTYASDISIELNGSGQYVSQEAPVCDSDLTEFYKIDESMSELNHVHEHMPLDIAQSGNITLNLGKVLHYL